MFNKWVVGGAAAIVACGTWALTYVHDSVSSGWLAAIQTVSTVTLVAVTGLYVVVTKRIADSSSESATASRSAAEASQTAAEAAVRAAALQEAALGVTFTASVRRLQDGEVWFEVTPESANVFVHSIVADVGVVTEKGALSPRRGVRLTMTKHSTRHFPAFIHLGEDVSFAWPEPNLLLEDKGVFGMLYIEYSFTEDGERRTRGVFCEDPDGIGDKTAVDVGVMPPRRTAPAKDA